MRRRAIAATGILSVGLAIAAWFFLSTPSKALPLASISPKDGVRVKGLPFKGINPHPLDGALRLYIGPHKWQTTIPYSPGLNFEWSLDGPTEVLSVQSEKRILMTWLLDKNGPLCVSGAERITTDPHATSTRD